MSLPVTPSDRIAELLIHIGRSSRSEDERSTLTAAQWTCLRFFARANRTTRTPSGFASFHATTRGTASQIIKSLEAQDMIVRRKSPDDGRSVFFDLTKAGCAALESDPLGHLIAVIDSLDHTDRAAFLSTLNRLTSALAESRGARAFGTCGDCAHFTSTGQSGYCSCMSKELDVDRIDQLCASYSPFAPAGKDADVRA
ncbi:MarR family winged helix-turn-helix transcriptional regulator [Roseobacter sinensis]|uniref:MarR family winged helix-turn-helix transcriptional regulator n=1 Tax=Roseobacter sinensis TaxID=2931391 RepID=A0ABT3BEK9_9RHOB|nr:MarR family winged helix-turn-helix transcriptional regulator [Roseobacter sp. WL0113]MCV3272013.1 MarR family winged helix-turn-helix transcriptional regulator [Roseobacter sp. WL0113]